jgi:hypothetical protein
MSVDPGVLPYLAILCAVVGAGQFLAGVWQFNQADNAKKFVGCVLQGGGLGLMGMAAVLYFAQQYDWAFIAGLVVMGAGSLGGSLSGLRFAKKQGKMPQ